MFIILVSDIPGLPIRALLIFLSGECLVTVGTKRAAMISVATRLFFRVNKHLRMSPRFEQIAGGELNQDKICMKMFHY